MGGGDGSELVQQEVFYWIENDDPFQKKQERRRVDAAVKRVPAEEVVKKHGIPLQDLQRYIENVINRNEAFLSLPFTLLFVAAYATMVIVHDDSVVIRSVENSVEFNVIDNANFAWDSDDVGHKNIFDVNSIADFWSWSRKGLLPVLFVQEVGFAESRNRSDPRIINASRTFSRNERGVLLNYNRIIGGVRFRQERSSGEACSSPEELVPFANQSCVGLGYELDPESWDARGMTNPEREAWLYVREDFEALEQQLVAMEAAHWLDRYTQKVEITVPIYTAEFGLHTMLSINFYFSRGGHIWKQLFPYSTYANWWTYSYYIAFDSIWVACLLHTLQVEMREIRRVVKQKGCAALQTDYIGFWNAVDWMSVIGGLIIVTLCLVSIRGTNRVNAETQALDPDVLGEGDGYRAQVSTYMDALEAVVLYVHIFKLVLSAYPLIIVLRLFKAFSAQPRLALVTDTLAVTAVDLVHFLLVFISIFMTLAISGLILFGRQLESFTTVPRAMTTVFRVMLGDFEWDMLRSVGLWEAFVWLFFTLGVMNLLLLNMVLAIVMDGYAQVKRASGNAATLPAEIIALASHWWGVKRGNLIDLEVINRALLHCQREFKAKRKNTKASSQPATNNKRSVHGNETPKLLGRDTIPVPGMCVEPVDEEIAKFVGPGKVSEVGQLLCRVLHEDGSIREYSVGHDLNYELMYVEGGEPTQELGAHDEKLQNYQVLSVLRFVKTVSAFAQDRMSDEQATQLMIEALLAYHKEHAQGGTDLVGIRQKLRQVMFRTRKMKQLFKDGGGGRTLSVGATEEVRILRNQLAGLYSAVAEDRRHQKAQLRALRREVYEDYWKLLRLQPEAIRELRQEADAEVFRELFDEKGFRRRAKRNRTFTGTSTFTDDRNEGNSASGASASADHQPAPSFLALPAHGASGGRAAAGVGDLDVAEPRAARQVEGHDGAGRRGSVTLPEHPPPLAIEDGSHLEASSADVVLAIDQLGFDDHDGLDMNALGAEELLAQVDATLRASAAVRGSFGVESDMLGFAGADQLPDVDNEVYDI
eukprot:TRINITY_DN6826_c0_g2_i1.p1 TRINITY_DN6826_c0_g2~~TRINITY_DN6826_c0_g2_i1.p1  ORF type:complete len:1042 (-),score=231.14 TRINITY_DN6826_c0_g2_i1:33-3158(-)